MAQVNQARPKADPMDRILKGLQIAQTVYGIKGAYDNNQHLAAQRAQAEAEAPQRSALLQAQVDQETAKASSTKAALERENTNTLTPKEAADLQKTHNVSTEPIKGGLAFQIKNMDGTSQTVYTTPKPKESDPLIASNRALSNQIMQQTLQKGKNANENYLPPVQEKLADKYVTDIARITTVKSQVDELQKQVANTQIPEGERLATANEQLKLLNSTLGADAVGEGEVKRLASYLQVAPDPFGPKGMKFGVDLDGFSRQLERISRRADGTIKELSGQVNGITGKQSIAPAPEGQQKQAAHPVVETSQGVIEATPDNKAKALEALQKMQTKKQGLRSAIKGQNGKS